MRLVAAVLGGLLLTSTLWVSSPASADNATVTLDRYWASTSHPVLSVTVSPRARLGSYTLSWFVEKDGYPVAGRSGTETGSMVVPYTVAPFDLPADGLADGSYYVVGTITTVLPDDEGTRTDTFNAPFGVDFTGPVVTSVEAGPTTIYPRTREYPVVPGYTRYVTITLGQGSEDPFAYAVMRNGIRYAGIWPANQVTDWNGRDDGSPSSPVVPEGTYSLVPQDEQGNLSSVAAQVTVSHKRLVRHEWVRTVTPRASLEERYVGRCSTLRSPARKAWRGSFGYHSNTRCSTKSPARTSVSSLHSIQLPAVRAYAGIRVDTVGGGARTRPRSIGLVRYLLTTNRWRAERRVYGRPGSHDGPPVNGLLTEYLFKNRVFAWGFASGYGNRYDVRAFTVRLGYWVLE